MGMAQDLLAADMRYREAINQGIPPDVAKSMAYGESLGEGETPLGGWGARYPYRAGGDTPSAVEGKPSRDAELRAFLGYGQDAQQKNYPRDEQGVREEPFSDMLRLPNGQYVPSSPTANPMDLLRWYQRQGNPNSFYWNQHTAPEQQSSVDPMTQMLLQQAAAEHPVLQLLRQSPGTQLAGDLLGFGGAAGDQTGSAPGFAGAMQNYLDPSNRRWDMHLPRNPADDTYPPPPRYMTPANTASVSPDLLRLLLQPPVA